jgi:hypothetical protein
VIVNAEMKNDRPFVLQTSLASQPTLDAVEKVARMLLRAETMTSSEGERATLEQAIEDTMGQWRLAETRIRAYAPPGARAATDDGIVTRAGMPWWRGLLATTAVTFSGFSGHRPWVEIDVNVEDAMASMEEKLELDPSLSSLGPFADSFACGHDASIEAAQPTIVRVPMPDLEMRVLGTRTAVAAARLLYAGLSFRVAAQAGEEPWETREEYALGSAVAISREMGEVDRRRATELKMENRSGMALWLPSATMESELEKKDSDEDSPLRRGQRAAYGFAGAAAGVRVRHMGEIRVGKEKAQVWSVDDYRAKESFGASSNGAWSFLGGLSPREREIGFGMAISPVEIVECLVFEVSLARAGFLSFLSAFMAKRIAAAMSSSALDRLDRTIGEGAVSYRLGPYDVLTTLPMNRESAIAWADAFVHRNFEHVSRTSLRESRQPT